MWPVDCTGFDQTHVFSQKEQASLGIGPVSAFSKSDFYTEGYRLFAIDAGIEIESNEIVFALSGSYSPGNLLTIEHQFGFAF